jgi:hypothetical protein
MSAFYELVGRLVVGLIWRSYGRAISTAAVAGVALVAIGAYLATREEDES